MVDRTYSYDQLSSIYKSTFVVWSCFRADFALNEWSMSLLLGEREKSIPPFDILFREVNLHSSLSSNFGVCCCTPTKSLKRFSYNYFPQSLALNQAGVELHTHGYLPIVHSTEGE